MKETTKKYLVDILIGIELVEEFVSEIEDFSHFKHDVKTQSAVERQLSIIGEAVNQFKKQNDSVEIEDANLIIGLRNRIIHAYFSIDKTIIWTIVINHLPNLKKQVNEILKTSN